jgi:phage terminase small subunit
MNPPADLGPAGLAAWGRASRALEGQADVELFRDLAARYARAVQLAEDARETWIDEGQVLTIVYSNGAQAPNPLLKIIRDAEADAHRYGLALGLDATKKGRAGRPPEAVPNFKRITKRSTPLRAVEDEPS